MQIEVKTITPEIAAVMLQSNPENRPVKQTHVQQLARDMAAGRWQLNGDAIRLNGDGSLIDGQHRLHACVISNAPFQSIVISGLPHEVRATIDGGVKRTYGDRLSMRNVPNANTVAAAITLMAGIATGQWRQVRLTTQEMDEILHRHPGLVKSASLCSTVFPKIGTMLTTVHYIGCYLGMEDRADAFANVWKKGVPTYQNDAAHYVRELFIRDANSSVRMTIDTRQRVFVTSWVKFSNQTPMRTAHLAEQVSIPGWSRASLGI